MGGVEQRCGDAVGEKGLPEAGSAVQKQVSVFFIKVVSEIPAFVVNIGHRFPRGKAGGRIDHILRVVIQLKI